MSKEVDLTNFRSVTKLESIRERFNQEGHPTYNYEKPDPQLAEKIFGAHSSHILGTPKNISDHIKPHNFNVIGGQCGLRTADLNLIQQGEYPSLNGEKLNKIEGNFNNFLDWLGKAISLDQIVDAIKYAETDVFISISEVKSWTEKITLIIEETFQRKLSDAERDGIKEALRKADIYRHKIINKYLQSLSSHEIQIIRVEDAQIYPDLKSARDELFDKIDLSVKDLQKTLASSREIENDKLSTGGKLSNFVKSKSLVNIMYTGIYVKLLQDLGLTKYKYTLINEPWYYPISNEADQHFFNKMMKEKGNYYFDKNSINSNIAFIPALGFENYGGTPYNFTKNISEVLNTENYQSEFKRIKKESKSVLSIKNNKLIQLSFNTSPTDEILEIIHNLDSVVANYTHKKRVANREYDDIDKRKEKVRKLKEDNLNEFNEHLDRLSEKTYSFITKLLK
jgi:virulence-associated protein VapD